MSMQNPIDEIKKAELDAQKMVEKAEQKAQQTLRAVAIDGQQKIDELEGVLEKDIQKIHDNAVSQIAAAKKRVSGYTEKVIKGLHGVTQATIERAAGIVVERIKE